MFNFWGQNYTTVASLKARAARATKTLKDAEPVIPHPHTRKMCLTWWGQEWCNNLESYADYRSRLERGRRYVRSNTVVDLKIFANQVKAKVQGTDLYEVTVDFAKPKPADIEKIKKLTGNRIANVEMLLKGNFPDELKELFTQNKPGLFPTPEEIKFDCDCLDWADMCKHVAAVMYGIGIRIDADPLQFFKLRGIDIDEFLTQVVDDKVANMLKNIDVKSDRIMKDANVATIFGI